MDLPIVKMAGSQKAGRSMHLTDMARYLDASTRRQQRRTTSHTTGRFGKAVEPQGPLATGRRSGFLGRLARHRA
ncbi:hypothetical protein E0E50_10270 [Azotobacter chroococcum subsp. isscasi]|nr:hypothetical protein E0E50_10270 [Azotobacter chroococcum subsp. isscasi]